MMKLKRYEMVATDKGKSCEMTEWIFGDYVKYSDVEPVMKENEALKAMVNELRQALDKSLRAIADGFESDSELEHEWSIEDKKLVKNLGKLFSKSPEQSLADHDKAVRDECANIAKITKDNTGDWDSSYWNNACDVVYYKILALNKE